MNIHFTLLQRVLMTVLALAAHTRALGFKDLDCQALTSSVVTCTSNKDVIYSPCYNLKTEHLVLMKFDCGTQTFYIEALKVVDKTGGKSQ